MKYDAVVIGSGPNGLAAAIRLAQKGLKVKVFEAASLPGGGARTLELTLPGFKHDICSAIHPLGFASPFFKTLPLKQYGLEWINPPAALAQPFDDGSSILISRSIEESSECFGEDYANYKKLIHPLAQKWHLVENDFLGPLRFPSHPLAAAKFGIYALQSAMRLSKRFKSNKTKSFILGLAAHGILPLDNILTSAIGLVLAIYAHNHGWPFPRGGSQFITNALAAYFIALGGEIETNHKVKNIYELPAAKSYLLDVTPQQLIQIAGNRFKSGYINALKKYKYGPAAFKIDFALDGAIPWTAENCKRSATVHLGASPDEIIDSELSAWKGRVSNTPFLIVAQQSIFDETRAPKLKHTAWAYCHVPNGYTGDASPLIENQIERFAPGFKKLILAKSVHTPADFEKYNNNYVGGDINGGAQSWDQLFTRPVVSLTPYRTPTKGIYICSSSTPPGGGVHGMCGFHAANTALKDLF